MELQDGQEYFFAYDKKRTIKLNSGRSALAFTALYGKFKRVFLPRYTCVSLQDALEAVGVPYELYSIDENFLPVKIDPDEKDLVLLTDYFGLLDDRIKQASKSYLHVFVDCTQAFYMHPIDYAYNGYSCRKFFGVNDGAYLIIPENTFNDDIISNYNHLPVSQSLNNIGFLINSIENGTNECYQDYKRNEERLVDEGLRRMSPFTMKMMASIDYKTPAEKRIKNYRVLENILSDVNDLHFSCSCGVPYIYPLLVNKNGLREYLIENNIFVSRWWKRVMDFSESTEFEKRLSQFLIPLPIDQRYSEKDMEYIAKKVLEFLV